MDNKKKNGILKSFLSLFGSLFRFGDKQPKLTEAVANSNEALLSPSKQIVKNFFSNKLGVIGLVTFIMIFVTVFGISATYTYDETLHETTLQNLPPARNYLKVPSSLDASKIVDIQSGISFSIALDTDGKLHFWGSNPGRYDVKSIIELTENKVVKHLAVGNTHVVAITTNNEVIGVGENAFNQSVPDYTVNQFLLSDTVKKIDAGVNFTVALLENGNIMVWGSTMLNNLDTVPTAIQGRVVDFEVGTFNILVILDDGTVGVFGQQGAPVTNIPENLTDGSIDVVDIAITTNTALALDSNGQLHAFGSIADRLTSIPEMSGKVSSISASRLAFYAIEESGTVHAWGNNKFGLATIPSGASNADRIFSDYFQAFATTEGSSSITAWGNKGFLLGSDDMGRDLAERLIQGGRVSLTVGAVAVFISTIIGVIVGLVSGFYGKWVDNLLMRIAEVVSSFPFLPLAITLSAILPDDTSQNTRLLMIMVILGIISWPSIARLVRGQILAEREKDFVLAARALGLKESVIIVKHILPSVLNLVVVSMTLSYASSLLTEAGLSFLGFGVRTPVPSWGNMLNGVSNSIVIEYYWWRWLLPALCVMLTALAVNLIGDALRDAMDPKSNQK